MNGVDALEANTRALHLLATLPFFDLDLAARVVTLAHPDGSREDIDRWANQYVFDLVAAGLLEDFQGLWRLPSYQRAGTSNSDWEDQGDQVAESLERFQEHARSKFGARVRQILGARGAALLQRTLAVVRSSDVGAFDSLVEFLLESETLGRRNDARNSVSTLDHYVTASDRRVNFLDALAKWQQGNRAEAAAQFDVVLRDDVKDKAAGIAAHLLAVYRHEIDADGVESLLERSEETLTAVGDAWGLTITHSTHGRILRDMARQTSPRDRELLEEAQYQYEQALISLNAVELDDLDDPRRRRAWIELGLADVLGDLDQTEAAIDKAERAIKDLPASSVENLFGRTLLARLYKNENRVGDALAILTREMIRQRRASRRADLQIAKSLNVLASVQRRSGDLSGAEMTATESFELGLKLGNQRHVAHAARTLAAIKLDRLPAGETFNSPRTREIRSFLYRAQHVGVDVSDLLKRLPFYGS